MNTIHQISLKLRMGIHPATQIHPELLRAMWHQLIRERAETLQAKGAKKDPRRKRASGLPCSSP